ncbi:MAG TPA: Gfo/Idh/MocA family oxidoreductase [Rectinemataceae bacterium]|nr:Gfo/Idh/MocA family oxidoreductase [Rectinemataceae bacterium]
METIGIGIIGCGRIADMAYEGYRNIPGVRIAAVCDSDETIALRRRNEWGAAKHYMDYRKLLEDPAVDAVEILTPHTTHVDITLDAISAGKHVALQKPMAVSRADAERLVSAAASAKTVCKVTENYIFYPPIRFVSRIISEGYIGTPSSISIKLIAAGKGGWPIPPSAWAWRLGEFAEGRGMQTFDHGHHLLSTARFLLGPIEKVSAWIGTTASVIDSPAAIMWKYRDRETFGLCEYVYNQEMEIPSRYYANDEWIQVSGSAGLVMVNRCTGELVDGPSVSLYSRNGWRHFQIPSDWKLGFIGSAWNFVRAIRGEEEPALTFPMAMEILSVDLAIACSAATGREVRLKPDGAILPPIAAYLKKRGEIRKARAAREFLTEAEGGGSSAESARFAVQLTSELPARVAAGVFAKEGLTIGLELTGATFSGCIKLMSIIVKGGAVQVEEDRLPENPDLVIKTSAGIWADILSGKKSVEKAYLHGRLKFVGPAETALTLKKLFSL